MNYVGATKTVAPLLKVLGTYELELRPLFPELMVRLQQRLVVVGAAEGYYAVGLLRNNPGLKAVAFEADEQIRDLLKQMAEINAVTSRLEIKGYCDATALECCLAEAKTDLLLMDIEGGENEVLDLEKVPSLRQCSILVEVHDCFVPGTEKRLLGRFEKSHSVRSFYRQDRRSEDIPDPFYRLLSKVPGYFSQTLLVERTENTAWLYLVPRSQN